MKTVRPYKYYFEDMGWVSVVGVEDFGAGPVPVIEIEEVIEYVSSDEDDYIDIFD